MTGRAWGVRDGDYGVEILGQGASADASLNRSRMTARVDRGDVIAIIGFPESTENLRIADAPAVCVIAEHVR